MGLRQALARWRSSEHHVDRRSRNASGPQVFRHQADPATGELVEVEPVSPPDPIGGNRIVGQADLRQAAVPMPEFYVSEASANRAPPQPQPPRPAPKPYDREVVRKAWDVVSERLDDLIRRFYAELFVALGDEAFGMFPPSMVAQREDFGRTLVQWVVTDDPEAMTGHLTQLGIDHRKFDVEPRHYDIAGRALLSAFAHTAGSAWTSEYDQAVTASYNRLASIMLDGAMSKQHDPKSWGATVIAHERVMGDFAVLRIQPDMPYIYKAGQYLTIEVESRPKEWRQMSIASAPRADNTFDIHVRAVAPMGVSGALVTRTKRGDRVRLGSPRGNDLVVEPGTVPGGLLCVCAGTGAAPISAVVESIMNWQDCPPLYAFVGGRTTKDMYPVDQLNRMVTARGHEHQVQVFGVVSDDPGYSGYRGRVEQIVPPLLDWARLGVDVLVAGPNTMISSTVLGLTGLGVPLEKIHFDQYDVAA